MGRQREPLQPQLPAPTPDFSDTVDAQVLEAPAGRALELIRAHLHEHGVQRVSVARHVHLGGPRRESQCITWYPLKASFHCQLCDTLIWTGEHTPTMVEHAQLFDSGLVPHLVGVRDPRDRDRVTRAYLDGTLNSGQAERLAAEDYAVKVGHSRPSVAERRSRVQEWMLNRYAQLGTVARVLEETALLYRTDPETWAELSSVALAPGTLKGYWGRIPSRDKLAAKERFDGSRSSREI